MKFAIQENIPLAPLTTIRLGGLARYFSPITDVAELKEALAWARPKGLPTHILGGGSNTVFSDKGFEGLVLKIELKGIAWGENGRVNVMAGEDWDPFAAECVRRDLAGVECLSGIPGSVGATPIQNVGAYGQEVAQTIVTVKALEAESRQEIEFQNSDCGFAYRWSRFKGEDKGKYIITAVEFQLQLGGAPNLSYEQVRAQVSTSDVVTVGDVREVVLGLRKKKSMVVDAMDPNTHSCGSFFENILLEQVPDPAGMPTFMEAGVTRVPSAWLIEQAGFPKGFRRGGVGISANHNLALVNWRGTAEELLNLAKEIQTAVKEKFGVELKREPVVV